MAAFMKKARECENAAGFFWELLAKPAVACLQVLLVEVLNLANRSPLQVIGNASGHPQFISG